MWPQSVEQAYLAFVIKTEPSHTESTGTYPSIVSDHICMINRAPYSGQGPDDGSVAAPAQRGSGGAQGSGGEGVGQGREGERSFQWSKRARGTARVKR